MMKMVSLKIGMEVIYSEPISKTWRYKMRVAKVIGKTQSNGEKREDLVHIEYIDDDNKKTTKLVHKKSLRLKHVQS